MTKTQWEVNIKMDLGTVGYRLQGCEEQRSIFFVFILYYSIVIIVANNNTGMSKHPADITVRQYTSALLSNVPAMDLWTKILIYDVCMNIMNNSSLQINSQK